MRLSYTDNGRGVPDDFNKTGNKSMGLKLMHLLVKQLDGRLEIGTGNGLSYELSFRIAGEEKQQN